MLYRFPSQGQVDVRKVRDPLYRLCAVDVLHEAIHCYIPAPVFDILQVYQGYRDVPIFDDCGIWVYGKELEVERVGIVQRDRGLGERAEIFVDLLEDGVHSQRGGLRGEEESRFL